MAEKLARAIVNSGRFETYMGGKEAVYWYNDDVWVIRLDRLGKLFSIWNPTRDVLVKA